MFIILKSVNLFIEVGTWRMSRPKNPNMVEKGLVEAGNQVFSIRDKKIEKKIVDLIWVEKTAPIYHLLNNFDDDGAWAYFANA